MSILSRKTRVSSRETHWSGNFGICYERGSTSLRLRNKMTMKHSFQSELSWLSLKPKQSFKQSGHISLLKNNYLNFLKPAKLQGKKKLHEKVTCKSCTCMSVPYERILGTLLKQLSTPVALDIYNHERFKWYQCFAV